MHGYSIQQNLVLEIRLHRRPNKVLGYSIQQNLVLEIRLHRRPNKVLGYSIQQNLVLEIRLHRRPWLLYTTKLSAGYTIAQEAK